MAQVKSSAIIDLTGEDESENDLARADARHLSIPNLPTNNVSSKTSSVVSPDPTLIKEDLRSCLDVINSGTFAASGLLLQANNPGLYNNRLGKVGLPLSERDAVDIARLSQEAPFGKGSETFVDRSVRRMW